MLSGHISPMMCSATGLEVVFLNGSVSGNEISIDLLDY